MKIFLIILFSVKVFAIYDQDSRLDYFELKDKKAQSLMKSISYGLYKHELRGWTFNKQWELRSKKFEDAGMCSHERFSEQDRVRTGCTSVLVGEDLLLTAGNCTTEHYCSNDLFYWMFDYLNTDVTSPKKISKNSFFKCEKVLVRYFDTQKAVSLTLMKLKGKAKGREIVKLNQSNNLSLEDELIVLGSFAGSTVKYSDGAFVLDQTNRHMIINSDISGESLGGAVFNKKTYELEGILIYGTSNTIYNNEDCFEMTRMNNKDGQELVLKSSYIYSIIKDFLK